MTKVRIPPPPGGTLTCPPGYVPIVDRDKTTGTITAECLDISSANSNQAIGNIVLSRLQRRRRASDDPITPDEQAILDSGKYEDLKREFSFGDLDSFAKD